MEINTLLLRGEGDVFSQGIEVEQLRKWSSAELSVFNNRLKKIVTAMHLLPQIVVVDFHGGAKGHAIELSLGADIRVSRSDACLEFDFISKGLCPSAGGIAHLQKLVGHSVAKFWIMSSRTLSKEDIQYFGLVHETYDDNREDHIQKLLLALNKGAPVSRVQAKRSFFEAFFYGFEVVNAREGEFARAAHICEDWKTLFQNIKNKGSSCFTSLRSMKKIVRSIQEKEANEAH